MQVSIRESSFDPWYELRHFQDSYSELAGKYGANAIFVGSMRDFNDDKPVTGMSLEHYPGMTEKHLQRIVEQARQTHQLLAGLLIHRVGQLLPNEPIVLVAVWTAHRQAAFAACRFILEELKFKAPFWKQETDPDGGKQWLTHNTSSD